MKNRFLSSPAATNTKEITNHSARKTIVPKLRAAGFEKCEIKNVTGHRNVQGLDPHDEGNSDNLQQMSAAITNDACIQYKNDSCVETPCSSASSSVYHRVNNNNAPS